MIDCKKVNRVALTGSDAKNKRARMIFKIVVYALLTLYLLWVLAPFYVVIITSLTSARELNSSIRFIYLPEQITLSAYDTVLFHDVLSMDGMSSILRGFLNTLWMTLIPTVTGMFMSGMAAFSYNKLRFRFKNVMYACQLATMMIPAAVLTMPTYLYYDFLGWTDSPLPLIIPGIFGNAAAVFFLRQFFSGIPDDLIEAAKIDGLGYMKMYVKIMIPLAIPAFLAQWIFMFVNGYNNFMGPLLYLQNDPNLYTLQLALNIFQGIYASDPQILCASAVLALIPLLIIYLFTQKFFVQGVAASGIKG